MNDKGFIALFLLLGGCASVESKDTSITNDFPDWFQEALEREAPVETSNKLDIPELNVTDEVLGKFNLVEQNEDYWFFASESEESSPVECYIFTDFDGAANTLVNVVDYELEYTGDFFESSITNRTNFGLDIDVVGNTPFIALDTLYNVEVEDEHSAGVVKAIAAQTHRSLIVCLHNEIGFKNTFYSLAESFISAIKKGEQSNLFYEPVYRLSINGNPVGFIRERYSFDDEGDVQVRTDKSLAVPVDEFSISRTDSQVVHWSFPDGALINASIYSVENGDVKANLSLSVEDDDWIVKGEFQGKEISETLAYDGWILSNYGVNKAIKSVLVSEEPSQEYAMWLEEVDPSTAAVVTLSEIQDNPSANVKIEMGPIIMDGNSDENGIVRQAYTRQGNVGIEMDIMHVGGSPVQ